MKLWKWHTLDRKQFNVNIILSFILCLFAGLVVNFLFSGPVIFKSVPATIIFAILVIIIFYQISPVIIKKHIKSYA